MERNSQPANRARAFSDSSREVGDGIPLVLDVEEESTVPLPKYETIEAVGLEQQRLRHIREEAERQAEEAMRKAINERFP